MHSTLPADSMDAVLYLLSRAARLLVSPLLPEELYFPPPEAGLDPQPVVSFSGCAMLYPWQLGVAGYISDEFETSALRCAGHSAGFAAALTLSAGVPESAHAAALAAAKARWSSRLCGCFLDSTRGWMAPYVAALAPHEPALRRAWQDGRLALGHTRLVVGTASVAPRWGGGWLRRPALRGGHCVTHSFGSLRELVYVVTVSQRLWPFYASPLGWLHASWGADGALSADATLPPRWAPGGSALVTVSPLLGNRAAVRPATAFPPLWFFTPPTPQRWAALLAAGREDAHRARATLLRAGLVPRGRRAVGGGGGLGC